MRVEDVNLFGTRTAKVAYFDDAADLWNTTKNSQFIRDGRGYNNQQSSWAGGTREYYGKASVVGDVKFSRLAEPLVDEFSNLAIADMSIDLEYNTTFGALDYQTALSGNPMCMFGATQTDTEKSPVTVYVDMWTSANVPQSEMQSRGIAVLALATALSVVRPVNVKLITGLSHFPTRTDIVQIVSVPTSPMDLSMASWMLGSTTLFRYGMIDACWAIAKSGERCGIPRISNAKWQEHEMGNWAAAQDGVKDVVHLPYMYGGTNWSDRKVVLGWIKKEINRFI